MPRSGRRRWVVTSTVLVLLALGLVAAGVSRDERVGTTGEAVLGALPVSPSCTGRPSEVLTGAQTAPYRNTGITDAEIIVAWNAVWRGAGDYPLHLEGSGRNACLVGGKVLGTYSDADSWERMHDTGAINVFSPGMTIDVVRVHNYGDGIRFLEGAPDFTVRAAHLTYVRDDCIENDYLYSGLVEDSLLDGCYVAFSARPHSGNAGVSGTGNVWEVRDSLIRLQPMPTVYRGTAPGHGGFFKWGDAGPRLVLRDNVFRADQDSNHTTMGIPPGVLADCSNNVMVWLGAGPYPATLPDCFRVTTDRAVWDRAVAEWRAEHAVTVTRG